MNDGTELQDFSVGKGTTSGGSNTNVSGANTYKPHNISSTPIIYVGKNPAVAKAFETAEAERTGSFDPYSLAANKAYNAAYSQAPKVSISNGKIKISAPQDVLDSPYYKQLASELQTLKGADLSSPAVQEAVDKLNDEIQNNFQEVAVKNTLGWTQDELNDYQYTIQTVRDTAPLRSSNYIKGKDKDGNIVKKTPKEWVDYWREVYNTDERADALLASAKSSNPYERTMYLLLTQGGDEAVYGFDFGEKLGQGYNAFKNQMKKFPEGTFRAAFGNSEGAQLVESDQMNFNIPKESFIKNDIINEEQFNDRIKNIWGKSWEDLSDDDKAFVLFLSRTNKADAEDRDLASKGRTRLEQLAGLHPNTTLRPEIQNMDSADAVARVLYHSDYDDFKKVKDSYLTWQNYEEDRNQDDLRLAKNAVFSSAAQGAGNFAGVIGRYLWEAAVIRGVTGGVTAGGVNVNAISDSIGEKIVSTLASKGLSPASAVGQNLMSFAANLIGTIPEDILQTSIDNVLTYNMGENKHLLDPDQMSDNLKQNLIVMSLFNAARAGINSVKRARMAKKLAMELDLQKEMNIEGINSDIDDVVRAKNKVVAEDGKAVVVNEDGTTKPLNDLTEDNARMIQQSLFDHQDVPKAAESDMPKVEFETVKSGFEPPEAETVKGGSEQVLIKEALETPIRATQADINNWHARTLNLIMDNFDSFIEKFHNKFGDVQVSDFDWIWYNTKFNHMTPEQIIGTVDPTTGRMIEQKHIDAAKWWAEQPQVKALRQASLKSLGKTLSDSEDFNILGYLPHTDYDPRFASFEEAMTGALWKKSTGASIMNEGDYKGYGGDFRDRYNTFASNMLWDARAKDVATSKLLDEARMEGQEITPELEANARKIVDGEKNITKLVNDNEAVKSTVKALESYTESTDDIDWKKLDNEQQKAAEDSGIGQSYHDVYAGNNLYMGSNSYDVKGQLNTFTANVNQLSDALKKISIDKQGSLYDNGAAALINSEKDAIFIANRYDHEGVDLRDAVTEVVQNRSHRSPEATEEVVDRIIGRIGQTPGPMTKGKLIQSLNNSLKWEAMTRMKRWLALAKYDQFNASTKKVIDRVLFNHVQMESIKNNSKIRRLGAKALDAVTSMRYRSLFYGNLKNALLQVSELNRFYSAFKWGDVAEMAKEMTTNAKFRARVDDMCLAVAPMTPQMRQAFTDAGVKLSNKIYRAYTDLAENMEVKSDSVVFKKLKDAKDAADTIGLAPIEAAETFKNRMMVAALVKEADNLDLKGDDALRHIRNRFERVGLAADEMGQLGMASNPLARTMLFLQNFQIRELGMHYYNIKDATGMAKSIPGKVFEAFNYLNKVFGAKLATTLILARLGYSATQTMGVDPFGLIDQYNQLNKEDMEGLDYFVKYNPLFSGGVMSLLSDMYFMARKAYEESEQKTVSDEAEEELNPSWGIDPNAVFSLDNLEDTLTKFIPGSTFANRFAQTSDMMDSGWAVSSTGNKMYTAPDDLLNTVLAYLFGRSATKNAQQYNQTYGDNILQTIGRFGRQINPWSDYARDSFDPMDTKNYTDWFKGDDNDRQQFEKGRRYFQSERDRIIDEYNDAISKSYASDDEIAEAKNNMNKRLEELYDKLERFVGAYEDKNGTIDSSMVKPIINILNTSRKFYDDTTEQGEERSKKGYNDALRRYASLGLSPVGTYSGANKYNPEADTYYQGSPQWRVTSQYAKKGAPAEAVSVLKEADKTLQPIRESLNDALSKAYNRKDYDEVKRIQNRYLEEFDEVVSPIIAAYGSGIFGYTDVTNQIKDMLSTGTGSRSGNLIPSDQYRKDKNGRYRSMPFETVDVKKWAQQRFRSNLYKNPTSSITSTTEEDIEEIKKLSRNGQKGRAMARALQLKVRVDNRTRALDKEQYNWLNSFIEGGK